MHYHNIWNWYLHLHVPQRVGLGIIVVIIGLALAAFMVVVIFIWLSALVRGDKQGWVPLLVAVILAVILMAAGVPLVWCLLPAFALLFCMSLFWDM